MTLRVHNQLLVSTEALETHLTASRAIAANRLSDLVGGFTGVS